MSSLPRTQGACRTAERLVRLLACVALLAVAGCRDAKDGRDSATISVRDSLRARRNASFLTRPDTFGRRVDSLRVIGSEAASVVVVVVSDFQCAECRRVARDLIPEIRRAFVDSGVARLAFVSHPSEAHFNARFAAHAALCAAASSRFWQMHDTLFAVQSAWERNDDPRPFFDSLAVAVGADPVAQAQCTQRQRLLPLMSSDIERSQAAGVTTVPTILIGNTRLAGPTLTLPEVRRAIVLARAG